MKLLLITLLTISSLSVVARTVNLNAERVNLGRIEQESSMPAFEEITINRTAQTPKKVELNFEYGYRTQICKEWDERVIIIPGNVVCSPNGCFPTPPETRVERYCVHWEREILQRSKEVKLNFSKAMKLSGSQTETFLVVLEQENLDKTEVVMDGSVIDAQTAYDIKFSDSIFTKPTLKFIAQ